MERRLSEALPPTFGVVLAGGRSRRMGSDKSLMPLAGTLLIERMLGRLSPQCEGVLVAAGNDPYRYEGFAFPIVLDELPSAGPLAGILAAFDWMVLNRPDVRYLVSVPVDTPFLPIDFVKTLYGAGETQEPKIVCASSRGQLHSLCALWPVAARFALQQFLEAGMRSATDFVRAFGFTEVVWQDDFQDPFFNANTPEDLRQAQALLSLTTVSAVKS